jgi:hypothetical protein
LVQNFISVSFLIFLITTLLIVPHKYIIKFT